MKFHLARTEKRKPARVFDKRVGAARVQTRVLTGDDQDGKQRMLLAFLGKYTRFENLAPGIYNFDDDE